MSHNGGTNGASKTTTTTTTRPRTTANSGGSASRASTPAGGAPDAQADPAVSWPSLTALAATFERSLGLDPDPKINSLDSARALLARQLYIPSETANVTASQLGNTLLVMANTIGAPKIGKTNMALLRALAILLHKDDVTCTAQLIAGRVLDSSEAMLTQMREANDKITLAASALMDATASINDQMTKYTRQGDVVQESVQDLGATTAALTEAAIELKECSSDAMTAGAPLSQPDASHAGVHRVPPATYAAAAAAAAAVNPFVAAARAKADADERNVLIDLTGAPAEEAKKQTEKDLVMRANGAIDAMGLLSEDRPDDNFAFRAARKLEHGGVWFLMHSAAWASWLRKPDVRLAFLDKFGGSGDIKERRYQVIGEYAPTTFNLSAEGGLAALARINGLGPSSIVGARWLKPPASRKEGQRTAFIEFTMDTPQAANTLIRGGCVIEGRVIRVRKKLVEPRRCMKCQAFTSSHTARSCPQEHVTCAKCSENHRTEKCTTATPRCRNCHLSHAASDRACRTYLNQVAKFRTIVPDNRFRYFPTSSDPASWELGDWSATGDQNRWYEDASDARAQPRSSGNRTSESSKGQAWGHGRAPPSSQPRAGARLTAGEHSPGRASSGSRAPSRPQSRQRTLHEVPPGGVLPTPRATTGGSDASASR
jgi:hypothetical protein